MTTDFIRIEDAEMVFSTRKGRFHALKEIDLTVAQGEFVTLIGHSGCGKSTLLNLIAGLLVPTGGVLLCDKREIAAPGPERAVVFQNHSLLPWLTCAENVHLAVERVFGGKESKAQLKARTQAALELVGMGHALNKRPHEISGGMKQRVGIARAIGHGAQGAADGRALRRPGCADPRPPAGRTAEDRRPHEEHGGDGDARRRRSRAAERPHRDDDQRPGKPTIGQILSVPLERPRNRVELAEGSTYVHCRKEVLDFLYTRHGHVEKAVA